MDRNKRLREIADSINTATKIRNLYRSNLQTNTDMAVRASNSTLLDGLVDILRESSPAKNQRGLSDALLKTHELSHTYRSLKQQISATRNNGADLQTVFNLLETIRPALGPKSYVYVDKLLKIHEILKS